MGAIEEYRNNYPNLEEAEKNTFVNDTFKEKPG